MGRAISPVTTLLAAVGLLSLSADALRYNATLDPYNVNKNQSKLLFLPMSDGPADGFQTRKMYWTTPPHVNPHTKLRPTTGEWVMPLQFFELC